MPVIVRSESVHPFLPSVGSLSAVEETIANKQDIRPLEIAIINLMAEKQTTERQLSCWLGYTPLQVKLTFAATDSYIEAVRKGKQTKNTPAEHVNKFYSSWSEIKNNKYDGVIITGVNALKDRVEQEDIWEEITKILDWTETNALSSLFLCWGAKAAMKHFHDINSYKQEKKLWGVYPHRVASDKTRLLFGFADVFFMPVSRWKTPNRKDIATCKELEIAADSYEMGPNVIVESGKRGADLYPKRVYVLAHPEYDTDTLKKEYIRDSAVAAAEKPVQRNVRNKAGAENKISKSARLPANYFPDDNPNEEPINLWRPCASMYSNWVHLVYQATPYDLAQIPKPHVVR
ncbi:MAG: homoserine O-succinyltransferase [Alphaproteobacteria bacterium]|nr:homoserine O-succinyltransferase [Alphaproteobacteria bacterium]MCL2505206.1 homoserine O-succinyltransferase [Alphaproteobacteria bacterium]